jgi:probable rRNA maturation factor
MRARAKRKMPAGRGRRSSGDIGNGAPPRFVARPVRIHNGNTGLQLDRRAIAAVVHELDAHAADILGSGSGASEVHLVPPGELSIAFLTDAALARLHAIFLGDPSTTDVITFNGTPTLGQAGEVCVSADTARTFAACHRRDLSEELTLYVVHGWLHLAGHDDLQPASKRRMRAAEARALALLRARRMIPRFAFV